MEIHESHVMLPLPAGKDNTECKWCCACTCHGQARLVEKCEGKE